MDENKMVVEMFNDMKHQRTVMWMAIMGLAVIAIALAAILALVIIHTNEVQKEQSIHYQDSLKEMAISYNDKLASIIEESDFYTEYEVSADNQSFNTGNLTVTK